MRAVILAAGRMQNYPYHKAMIKKEDYIICADGGLMHANAMGTQPHLILGDFDSFKGEIPKEIERLDFPVHKDYTDTHIAVDEALKRGYKEILILGAIGTRVDHTYANICLLEYIMKKGACGTIADDKNEICLIYEKKEFFGKKGDLISLLPLDSKAEGICTFGLEYPLSNATIERGESIGVSNVFLGEKAEVSVEKGILLCIRSRD